MCSVFRKDDVVYHASLGQMKVVSVGNYGICELYNENSGYEKCGKQLLSFSPWPKPNHERPFTEVGYWIGKNIFGDYLIRWRVTKDHHKVSPSRDPTFRTKETTEWIKFLGTEL